MRPVALAGILVSTTILSGCAGTVAGVSFSSISSFAGFASTIFTGADLGEHAVSLVTGKDCRFSEGLVRADRDICEEPGSPATRNDFHGIFVERIDADGTVIFAAPKYMPVNLGDGETTTDAIWTEIKTAKAKEETERQLARANAQQQIDVAALAASTVSSESLAFMPTNSSDFVDGDTASQTAQLPRSIVNAAGQKPVKDVKEAAPATTPVDTDQPALDAMTFAATTPAAPEGAGGPFIATASSGTPVTSKLINGQPVVVLRLRPSMSAASSMPVETAAATPSNIPDFTETAAPLVPTKVATNPVTTPRSPQMIITDVPVRPTFPATPTRVAQVDPNADATTTPRTKPVVEKLADKPASTTAKPATEKKPTSAELAEAKATGAPKKPPIASTAAYEPPEDAAFAGSVPVQAANDIPEPADTSGTAFSQPEPTTPAPSPLIPMQQE